jgi:hypothetical protein
LKSDGTVVAAGKNKYGQCNVDSWKNVIAVEAAGDCTFGLRADGTVVAVGDNEYGQCNVSDWRDIVAVTSCGSHTVGLKSDGTVAAVGWNSDGECNTSNWRDIGPISEEKQILFAKQAREEESQKAEAERIRLEPVKRAFLSTIESLRLYETVVKRNELRTRGVCLQCSEKMGLFGKCKVCKEKASPHESMPFDINDIIVPLGGYDWRILDRQDGIVLLLSEKIIERREYDHGRVREKAEWETCSLREYLNGEFYDMLNDWEKQIIVKTSILNHYNRWSASSALRDLYHDYYTDDMIFILSLNEAVKYFGDSGQLGNRPRDTRYLSDADFIDDQFNKNRIAYGVDGNASSWWLRTTTQFDRAVYIWTDGSISVNKGEPAKHTGGVRPALWLRL